MCDIAVADFGRWAEHAPAESLQQSAPTTAEARSSAHAGLGRSEAAASGRYARLEEFVGRLTDIDRQRSARVVALREAIRTGRYDLDDAFERALVRMLGTVGAD